LIYGYPKGEPLNEYGLVEMKEVTFVLSPDSLRQVASFLNEMAAKIETKTNLWHEHISSQIDDWGSSCDCEIIVTQ